jgi:hypothetical protein
VRCKTLLASTSLAGALAWLMFVPVPAQAQMAAAIKDWKVPTAWTAPYDAEPTKTGNEVWAGSMLSDQVERLFPETGEIVEYLLPHSTNIRRVFANRTEAPCCGLATATAQRSSGWNRWIEPTQKCATDGNSSRQSTFI